MTKNKQKPIILIGMMGAGKTTCGKILSDRLGETFIDSDAEIEKTSGKTIAQIFADDGETAFRSLEQSVILKILKDNPSAVISTGGGAVTNPQAFQAMLTGGIVCWLQSTPEELYDRIRHDTRRPLMQTENQLQTLRDLLAAREPLYRSAHIHVHVSTENPASAVDEIIKLLSDPKNQAKQ